MTVLRTCLTAFVLALSVSPACRAQQARELSPLNNGVGQYNAGRAGDAPGTPRGHNPPAPLAAASDTAPDTGVAGGPDGLVVGAVLVEGAPELDPAVYTPVVAPFIGRPLHRQDLQNLLAAISGLARRHGYVLCRSAIPAQTFRAGLLRIKLDLGRIDRIDLIGDPDKTVRAVLSPLLGKPAVQTKLERQLVLAGDLPGIEIGNVSYVHDGDKGVLRVEVRHTAIEVHASLDNRGNASLGPMRLAMAYDLNGILGDDRITLSLGLQTTPTQPGQLFTASSRMAYVFDDAGSEVALATTYSRTRPGGPLAGQGFGGLVRDVAVEVRHPLLRSRRSSVWAGASLEYQALDQWQDTSTLWRDRTALLGLFVNASTPFAGGRLRAGLTAQSLLALQGLTLAGDPLASRPGAGGGARFVNGWANWQGPIAGPVSARLAFSGQLADAPLPIAQQLSVGGPDFGRAYDYSERTGDEGALGSVELQLKVPDRFTGPEAPATLYGFADAGYVSNLTNALGTGTLVSAGFGSRISLAQTMRVGLELAFPVNQPRLETDSRAPRFSLNLGANF